MKKKKAVSADAPLTLLARIIRSGADCRVALRALMALALLQVMSAHAQPPPVLQRGYDANVSGAALSETTLNTSNVVPGSFGLVFTLSVDDNIMAQPLYVPGVMVNGVSHNVLYVASMSDTVYAFDADVGGAPLWQLNLATFENATPVPIAQFAYSGNKNIINNLGVLSTPVIDSSTNTLYVVACTLENGTLVYRLHALDITSGTPRSGSGVVIQGSYTGPSATMTFDARNAWQRASLVLVGTNVVFGFGALEAEGTGNLYSGWMMAYDKTALTQTGIFATETVGNGGGGVWQSGRPPVVDGSGYVYVFTGNGYTNGYDGVNNFSESVLKLNPASSLGLVDWFTPSTWATLDGSDLDLSSSGPLLIPNTTLLAGGGKSGIMYVLNPASMNGLGHETTGDTGAVQEITIASGSLRGGPVYWQRSSANGGPLLYDWGSKDALKAFAFNGGTFATTPSAQGIVTNQAFPGGILTVSANADTPGTGVLWATVSTSGDSNNNPPTPGALYAFNANNVATELWNSTMNPADSLGNFAKFVPPLVANGRVYVATWSKQVAVYGLLTPAAAPTFTPAAGTYASAQSVQLSSTTAGASIYYTTNGTTPTTSSTLYSSSTPIPVSSTMTIEAIATAPHYAQSTVASAAYTINTGPPPATTVSLVSTANVDAYVNNGSAVPSGGLDGDGFAYSETLVGTSLTWNGNTYNFGAAGTADAVSNTTVPLPAGNYSTLSFLAVGVNGNQRNQVFTVNYSDGTSTTFTQSLSDWFTPQSYPGESEALVMAYRINTNGTLDNRTFYLYGYSFTLNSAKTPVSLTLPKNRNVIVLAIDLIPSGGTTLPPAAAPTFTPAAGTYSSAQSVQLASTTAGASIYYTINGTPPSTNSTLYNSSTPISVSTTETIEAIAVASGYSNSAVASSTYTINIPAAAAPTFTPTPGNYPSAQSVQLASTTAGASIYYTINGTPPSTNSTLYNSSTPISVSSSEVIEAIAVASGYSNSAVASGTYTIGTTSGPTPVSLSSSANVDAIVNNGADVPSGGLDGDGYAYSETLVGTSLSWNGNTYSFGAAGTADAVSNTTVPLPAGNYSTLSFLAVGVNANQQNQSFIVNYSDGSSTTFKQSLSDWFTPQSYPGESEALVMAYRVEPNGALDNRTFYLFGYSFTLNSAKTPVSLILPANRNVVVLAIDVSGTTLPPAAAPTFTPAAGTYSSAQSVQLASTTAGASIYYTINGTPPSTNSTLYNSSTPISVSTTETIEAIAVASGYSNSAVASSTYTINIPAAAAPTFTPTPGNYPSAQSVQLASTTAGASIYYTINGTPPSTNSTLYNSSTPISVSSSEVIEAIAVASGYSNSAVASGTYTIGTTSGPTPVSLSSSANVDAIVNNGADVPSGGLDGDGYAYSETLVGTSLSWNGNTYSFGAAGTADAVSNTTVPLPAGNYSTLSFLAVGVNANQQNQSFIVNYSDGSSTTFKQSLSDWFTPQSYPGESEALVMAYRVEPNGALDNRTFYLFGYSFTLNSAKTPVSLILPANRNVVVLAIDIQ